MTPATATGRATEATRVQWDPACVPPFPAIALKALQLMSGTDASLIELCNLIRPDPAFSTAVLRIANSPLIAFSKNVTNVLQASMLLGFQRLKCVVITVGMKAYLQGSLTPLMRSCFRHSVACAIIAERSASRTAMDKEFAYTAGILHDIGRVALASLMPESYARVVKRGAQHAEDLLHVEQELCGINHCQAGRALVEAWNLPEAFLELAAFHHDRQRRSSGAAALLAPSCELADSLGFEVVRYSSPRSYAEILAEFPEAARAQFPANAKDLAFSVANEIKVIEWA